LQRFLFGTFLQTIFILLLRKMNDFLSRNFQDIKAKNLLFGFLFLVLLLNLLQATLTGLHPDEAYYWVYAKFLDWGYFDHPPLVAIFIKTGDFLFQNKLGLRLITVLSHICSLYILWLIVKKYGVSVQLYIILISSILLFHVYSFITTPDAPLFFFSVLFLYIYQRYLQEDRIKWAILLGVICAGLLLSKYHGILLIFFVLISNLKLFTRKSFYLTIIIAFVLFAPHIYWQYVNGYPSVYYHLIDRSATPYLFIYSAQYPIDQLLMMGPLTGWLLFYYGFKADAKEDAFLRACKFVVYGVLIFFFISTYKGRVQAQWPLIEFIALFILAAIYASKNTIHFIKFKWFFAANLLLILAARFIIMGIIPASNQINFVKSFLGYDTWAQEIKAKANGNPVLFLDGFQEASYYNFYTQSLNGVAYNSFNYRKTQYDLWPLADDIQHRKILLVTEFDENKPELQNINSVKGKFNIQWIDSLRYYPKVDFEPLATFPKEWKVGEEKTIEFIITNPQDKNINFSNRNEKWTCSFLYGYLKEGEVYQTQPILEDLNQISLKGKECKKLSIKIKAPIKTGDYKLFLSIKTAPFAGTRNSKMISLKVNP
jgi:predicted RNA-binding protein